MPQPTVLPTVAHAAWTTETIVIDGRLDETVWQPATACLLLPPADRARNPDRTRAERDSCGLRGTRRPSTPRFAFHDRDVVQESSADQQHPYRTGDVAELFLKPLRSSGNEQR